MADVCQVIPKNPNIEGVRPLGNDETAPQAIRIDDNNPVQTAESGEYSKNYYVITKKHICLIGTILIGISVMCACLVESFHYIDYEEYGLLQDNYGEVRLSKVYDEGRYFFPLNYDVITFPAKYIPVTFDAIVFSETGLEFSVEIGFYYKLPKENIGDIYDSFSHNYHDRVVSNAKTTIKNSAADLSIDYYLTNRSYVESLFAEAVEAVLSDVLMIAAPTSLFRVGSVQLPDTVIELSLESAIAIQRNEILQNTQEVVVIRSETARLVAVIDADTNRIMQFAEVEATRLIESSNAYANKIDVRSRGIGISSLVDGLNFTSSNYTLDIIKRLAQLDNSDSTTYVSVPNSLIELSV